MPDQHRSLIKPRRDIDAIATSSGGRVGVLNRQPRLRQSPGISIVSVRGGVEVAHTSVEGRRVERGTGARQLCDTA